MSQGPVDIERLLRRVYGMYIDPFPKVPEFPVDFVRREPFSFPVPDEAMKGTGPLAEYKVVRRPYCIRLARKLQ